MPDLSEPGAREAALTFGVSCILIALIGGGLSEEPALALRADGIMALLATFFLVARATPAELRSRTLLPLRVRDTDNQRRHGVTPRLHAHLWFAQWMAALAAASLAASLVVG
jgi:hypothetical protein